ncbi:MAG: DUF2284 domain-containing protein [Clostridia bacterium]|nr:DUF2284 domain-containing protein [Clostridia bacterium]
MEQTIEKLLSWGAYKAAVVEVEDIEFDRRFREQCASNACGCYGKNYMCPPDAGDIDELIDRARRYDKALVYQTVSALEDSYDFEGMMEAGKRHHRLTCRLREAIAAQGRLDVLHLGAGGCRECPVCAKAEGLPCRKPELATPSLEAYGIAVSKLATLAGMKYINGQDTVTYFGAMLYKERDL